MEIFAACIIYIVILLFYLSKCYQCVCGIVLCVHFLEPNCVQMIYFSANDVSFLSLCIPQVGQTPVIDSCDKSLDLLHELSLTVEPHQAVL